MSRLSNRSNYTPVCWCTHTHITLVHTHTKVSKTCFSSFLWPYMEAISPLPRWLLRIGGHFILPVLIRMSAGSVTCNLSTKPQQLRRDGEHSYNDIILDWGRVSGGDRWCRFSSPCTSPSFPPDVLKWDLCNFHLYIMGPLADVKVLWVFFPEFIYPRTIFLHSCCINSVLKQLPQGRAIHIIKAD